MNERKKTMNESKERISKKFLKNSVTFGKLKV